MPLVIAAERASLHGIAAAGEAETLLAWLLDHPAGAVDLAACRHLHTAVLQVLLALRPAVAAAPSDPRLANWLMPLLGAQSGAAAVPPAAAGWR